MSLEDNSEVQGEYEYKTEDLLSTKKEDRKKKREERRLRKHYKFTDKKHPVSAIVSFILGVVSVALFIWAIVLSVLSDGNAGTEVGIIGVAALACTIVGMVLSILSLYKKDVKMGFAWAGLIINGLLWFFMFCMVLIFL